MAGRKELATTCEPTILRCKYSFDAFLQDTPIWALGILPVRALSAGIWPGVGHIGLSNNTRAAFQLGVRGPHVSAAGVSHFSISGVRLPSFQSSGYRQAAHRVTGEELFGAACQVSNFITKRCYSCSSVHTVHLSVNS